MNPMTLELIESAQKCYTINRLITLVLSLSKARKEVTVLQYALGIILFESLRLSAVSSAHR